MDIEKLRQEAILAKQRAYAPYSGFRVGAAVLGDDGRIHVGANVECASYGGTICAERAAVAAAVSSGARRILAVAVSGDTPQSLTPCGICRQVLAEFAEPETPVWCGDGMDRFVRLTLEALLPYAFTPRVLTETTPDAADGDTRL